MPSAYQYNLPNKKNLNKRQLCDYLREIRDDAVSKENLVVDPKHIEDLKYFIRFIYVEAERIIEKFEIENCYFFIDFPPARRNGNKCLWVGDKNNKQHKQHFSTTQNGLSKPTPEQNFYGYFTYVIQDFKNGVKRNIVAQKGMTECAHLWHETPKTKEIIAEFINKHHLEDKLAQVISPNGLGNNLPFLNQGFEYLVNEILEFYVEKVENKSLEFNVKQYIGKVGLTSGDFS